MNIIEAGKAMESGSKVRRTDGSIDEKLYFYSDPIKNGFIHFGGPSINPDIKPWPDMLTTYDLMADDWEIVDE